MSKEPGFPHCFSQLILLLVGTLNRKHIFQTLSDFCRRGTLWPPPAFEIWAPTRDAPTSVFKLRNYPDFHAVDSLQPASYNHAHTRIRSAAPRRFIADSDNVTNRFSPRLAA